MTRHLRSGSPNQPDLAKETALCLYILGGNQVSPSLLGNTDAHLPTALRFVSTLFAHQNATQEYSFLD